MGVPSTVLEKRPRTRPCKNRPPGPIMFFQLRKTWHLAFLCCLHLPSPTLVITAEHIVKLFWWVHTTDLTFTADPGNNFSMHHGDFGNSLFQYVFLNLCVHLGFIYFVILFYRTNCCHSCFYTLRCRHNLFLENVSACSNWLRSYNLWNRLSHWSQLAAFVLFGVLPSFLMGIFFEEKKNHF